MGIIIELLLIVMDIAMYITVFWVMWTMLSPIVACLVAVLYVLGSIISVESSGYF